MSFLCNITELNDPGSLGIEIGDNSLFAVKKDGEYFLYRNVCPHLGIELHWLENQFLDPSGSLIQCSTHGALFLIDSGECVAGPCGGQFLRAVDFEIRGEEMHLSDSPDSNQSQA